MKMDNKEKIRLAINQISVNNCDGSANEESIKAIRYLQEVSDWLRDVEKRVDSIIEGIEKKAKERNEH